MYMGSCCLCVFKVKPTIGLTRTAPFPNNKLFVMMELGGVASVICPCKTGAEGGMSQ
jgi:hypothetical protein